MASTRPSKRGEVSIGGIQRCGLFAVMLFVTGCGGRAEHSGTPTAQGGAAGIGSGGMSSRAGAGQAAAGASATGGVGAGAGAGGSSSSACSPGSAPLRRLTRAEYIASLNTLFGDVSQITGQLPQEFRSFPVGNWAENQSVGFEQAAAYARIAKQLAERATQDAEGLAKLGSCAALPKPDAKCARSVVEAFASRAFRRAPTEPELNDLLALHTSVTKGGADFARATAAVIAAVLQAPDFLYRIEWGLPAGPRSDVRRLTGDEMASRLSYLFWGTSPDEGLRAAAQSGALLEPDGIAREAARLFDDPRSHAGLAAFFDDYLQLYRLPDLVRDDPAYSPAVGASLQRATQRFLEAEIFEKKSSWSALLTADHAFVNGPVAPLFGVDGIVGETLREVKLDPTKRLGLLTQPSVLMVTNPTNSTNPTQRGYFIMEKVLCRHVPHEPPEAPPIVIDPPTGAMTTRERWTKGHLDPSCASCHQDMDQLGFAFENYDALGRYRTQEQGLNIDTAIAVTGLGPTNGPIELVQKLATLPEARACFAMRLAEFGLGKSLSNDSAGACLAQDLARHFEAGGDDLRQLLLDFTQSDAFLYLPKDPGK